MKREVDVAATVPRLSYSDYWPVDVDKLRPAKSYDQMIEIRRERMKFYLDDGVIRPELAEPRRCPVCGSEDGERLFAKEGFSFVQCGRCHLVFLNPCPRDETSSRSTSTRATPTL